MKFPAWAAYVANKQRPMHVHEQTWATWMLGKSRPPVPRVRGLVLYWGDEAGIMRACGRQSESVHGMQSVRADNRRAAFRQRYSQDEAFRRTWNAKDSERQKRRLRERAHKSAHLQNKLLREEMTPEQIAEFDHQLRLKQQRRSKAMAKARGYKRPKRSPKPWGWTRIKHEITSVKARLARLERALREETRPWRVAGFATMSAWAIAHPEDYSQHMRPRWKRNTYRRKAIAADHPGWTIKEWYALLKASGYRCAYCGISRIEARRLGHDLEVDHVIPLTRGGIDAITNLAPACKSCNSSKADRTPMEWAAWKEHRHAM